MVEVLVEHDYVAKEPDEISISKGDVIKEVVKKQPGWCEGTLNDKKGLFPDNFVKIIEPVTLRNKRDVNRVRKCRVIFSYVQDHEDELDLNIGEEIEIIGEEEEGWWRGKVNDKVGVFPSNFVEEIHRPTSREDLTDVLDVEHKIPSLPPKPSKILCEVKYRYQAQNDDELALNEGDIVTLISKEGQDAGWWRGELSGKIGVFPDNFVVLIEDKRDNSTTPEPTKPNYFPKYVASQRKSFEPKPIVEVEAANRVLLPPAVPSKKPIIPIKKSPSGSGTAGGLFSGLRKKIVDAVDGASISKSGAKTTHDKTEFVKSDDGQENAFDQVERSSLLPDVRATRAKAPGRRPPSTVFKEGEPGVTNGNSDYGSMEILTEISSSNTSIEQEGAEMKPKVREWEKHKAPWLAEMKMNQAKRTSTSPGPETRTKLTTPERTFPERTLPEPQPEEKCKVPVEKEASPVDMSKSMPSFTKIAKTPPNELDKGLLRNKPAVVAARPQTIATTNLDNAKLKISPIIQPKTPSPIPKPIIIEKPTIIEETTNICPKQYNELLERINKLELLVFKQNEAHKLAIEDLHKKLQLENEMRMLIQSELEKVTLNVMQV